MAALLRVTPKIARPVSAALLLMVAGCKPASAPSADPTTSSSDNGGEGHGSRQPSAREFNAFFQTLLPAVVKVADLKTDLPVRMPYTSPGSNTWLISVKITLEPTEDLLALPPSEDVHVVDELVSELNTLIGWGNAYGRSPYARTYGTFDVKAPTTSVPQLLVVRQAKNKPLAPLYGKIAAEWQVDHWQFSNVDLELPQMGQLLASFNGPTMVKGHPETEAFMAAEQNAVAEAQQKQATIEGKYAKDLLGATKPGTTYRGQISHARGIIPCEVRFLDTPGADPQMAMFEIRVALAFAKKYAGREKFSREIAALSLKLKHGVRYHGPLGIRFKKE